MDSPNLRLSGGPLDHPPFGRLHFVNLNNPNNTIWTVQNTPFGLSKYAIWTVQTRHLDRPNYVIWTVQTTLFGVSKLSHLDRPIKVIWTKDPSSLTLLDYAIAIDKFQLGKGGFWVLTLEANLICLLRTALVSGPAKLLMCYHGIDSFARGV